MTSDAVYTVTCDQCGESQEIQPEVFHRDYSGKSPMIDLSQDAIDKECRRAGFVAQGDDKHLCENCAPEDES